MNLYFLIAGLLSILVGLVHSLLGESMIFRHLRAGSLVPTQAKAPMRERHLRIIWATWHVTSFFGWAIGAALIYLAVTPSAASTTLVHAIATAMLASGLLVLYATRGRHPGWIGLSAVAVLCWLALLPNAVRPLISLSRPGHVFQRTR